MIRGIDTQMAVQRLADYTKDANAQMRRTEMMHDFNADLNRAHAQLQQKQVQMLEQKEQSVIKRRQQEEHEQQKKKKKKSEGQQAAEPAAEREEILLANGGIQDYHVKEPKQIRGMNIDIEV